MAKNRFELFDDWQMEKALRAYYATLPCGSDDPKMQKRREELCALLRKVIRNELSEQDQLLVKLHWFQGKSKKEIASLTGLSRSSVYRRFAKISDTLYEKLKYALDYRFEKPFAEAARAMIRQDPPAGKGLIH